MYCNAVDEVKEGYVVKRLTLKMQGDLNYAISRFNEPKLRIDPGETVLVEPLIANFVFLALIILGYNLAFRNAPFKSWTS